MSTCYANPNPPFQPAMRLIASITNANPATVTTTFDHDYESGLIVRLNIPLACGMFQVDKLTGVITVTGATTFTINIDTTSFDAFSIPVAPAWNDNTCATVVPVGESNDILRLATRNVL